ncbi:unnamed protein product [Sphagnum jensenii]|uniref:Uncharacterized protein n=1 Tax=Sphagnum jensenii TaxID=128206 RepID=A0ABP1BG52_9BRYO
MITVTTIVSPGKRSGLECGNPKCGFIDINSFCQSPNKIAGGPGDGCYNVDGPTATSPTNGTEAFANVCPDAFSYSTDIANHVYFVRLVVNILWFSVQSHSGRIHWNDCW